VRDKIYAAFYALAQTDAQMKAYVCDTIRSSLCNLTLDEAFESKEDIANELKKHLTEVMASYGISIVTALVTDLSPDVKVRFQLCLISGKYFPGLSYCLLWVLRGPLCLFCLEYLPARDTTPAVIMLLVFR
jgi:hypothetical protein